MMKKIAILSIFFLFTYIFVFGQSRIPEPPKYGIKMMVHYESNDHNIEKDSYCRLKFYDENNVQIGQDIQYYLGKDLNDSKNWFMYPTFQFSTLNKIKKIHIYGEHKDEGSNIWDKQETRGTINTIYEIEDSSYGMYYPCIEKHFSKRKFEKGKANKNHETNLDFMVSIFPISYSWLGDVHINRSGLYENTEIDIIYENGDFVRELISPQHNDQKIQLSPRVKNNGIKSINVKVPGIVHSNGITFDPVLREDRTLKFRDNSTIDLKFNTNKIWAEGEGYFYDEDPTTIKTGETHDRMIWAYSKDSITWDFIQPYKVGRDLNITTKMLFGNDFWKYLAKPIFFKAVYENCMMDKATETAPLLLITTISSPHIDSVTYQKPNCYKGEDAKLFVHLDRKLMDKETLKLSHNGGTFEDGFISTATDSIVEIQNLKGDSIYTIAMLGSYQFGSGENDKVPTYTDGLRHKDAVYIPDRAPLSLYLLKQDLVKCYGGKDGKIMLTAHGGNDTIDAILKKGNELIETIRFNSLDTITFSNLSAGIYTVLIKDSYGCDCDSSLTKIVKTIEVEQPREPVKIDRSLVQYEEPKGFGRSDGWAQIKFKGSKDDKNAYSALWKDSLGIIIPDTITFDGTHYISQVKNIRSSRYSVSVFDSNYTQATPPTIENTCGCIDTISFFVEEPPMLEVYLKETRYITCNGDSDGQITAYAKGGRHRSPGLRYKYEWQKVDGTTISPLPGNDTILAKLPTGYYRVRIIDRNNIDTVSEKFHLIQPDILKVRTKVLQNIECSGETTGIIEAIASGGVPPYNYKWSNDDRNPIATGLTQGNYILEVTDSRYNDFMNKKYPDSKHYCSVEAFDSIIAPNAIRISGTVKHPICNSYSNGEIKLNVTGGVPPYSYQWDDGATTANRNNLPKGTYKVTVIDSKNCSLPDSFTLIEPNAITVNLGEDFVLCKGQSVMVNGDIGINSISYKWTDATSKVLATTSALDINKAGTYTLTATTLEGCTGSDEIKVGQIPDVVSTDFVIATTVANNTKLYAVNITKTLSDSIAWILPDEVSILNESTDRIELLFPDNGDYTIGLTSYKNTCSHTLYKTITVVDKGDIKEDTANEPFLKRFVVSPNPSNGEFEALVELREPASYKLQLYDSNGKLVEKRDIQNKIYNVSNYSVAGKGKGIYYLRLVSPQITSVFKIIIQ